jgi:DnaJ-related protein SCJ1
MSDDTSVRGVVGTRGMRMKRPLYEPNPDRQTRKIYDRHGEEGLKQHEARKQGGGHSNDPFARFFGGGGQQQEQRGPGMLTNLEVSLADMYTGRTVEVSGAPSLFCWWSYADSEQFQIPRKVICNHCHGSGAHSDDDIKPCDTCKGQGVTIQRHQVFPGMFTNVQMT